MSPRSFLVASLRLLLCLLLGVAPGFLMGVLLGASHYPWRWDHQLLFSFVFWSAGGMAAALCPLVVGTGGYGKRLKWCAVGLLVGTAQSALVAAAGWWMNPHVAFTLAFLWWGIVFGTWCGWLRGYPASGALCGLLLTSL